MKFPLILFVCVFDGFHRHFQTTDLGQNPITKVDEIYPDTPRKTNMDTQNHSLEKVTPVRYGRLWYLC